MTPAPSPSPAARAYLEGRVLSASPGERLLLTYDAAAGAASAARAAAERGDAEAERRGRRRLAHLLILLIQSVDPAPDPVLASRLITLYQWCLARLGEPAGDRVASYAGIAAVLSELRAAFAQVAAAAGGPR